MSPAEKAMAVDSHAGFASDLLAHLAPGGVVVSNDVYFIMARPVRRDASVDALLNPWMRWEDADAWMVWLAAGDMAQALGVLWPMFGDGKKWLAFQRRDHPQFVRVTLIEILIEKLYGQRQRKQQGSTQFAEGVDGGFAKAGQIPGENHEGASRCSSGASIAKIRGSGGGSDANNSRPRGGGDGCAGEGDEEAGT